MTSADFDLDVVYKVTIVRSLLLVAPREADEREIIARAVEEYNSLELENLYISPRDVSMVQVYDDMYDEEA